ncbi:hypothetical protein FOL47_004628 [Perkinsus chesapeaki]|uniref:Uncharacterized protein n=1 Tax=Perkinsus chesapeaki TaxID=330153 RepID=A0A7J6M1T5_PERCH|nr:hypothetical protein FOL47_004628 [Perkinsus chesapeaki]
MSTDPVILSALASRIVDPKNDESLRYFEVVTTKRGGKPKLCYICIGRSCLYMVKMNMKGTINGGTIDYEWIDKVVVDPANNSALLLILGSHQDGGWQDDQVPIASDGRHSLLSHLIIAWQTHYMCKSDKLRYLPVVEFSLGAAAGASETTLPFVPVQPFRGCVKKQVEGYYVFMREDYQAESWKCRQIKPTDREFRFIDDKGIECIIEIGDGKFVSEEGEVDLRFLATEHKLVIVENDKEDEWFSILREGPYMKRMNLCDDLAAWQGWEFILKTMSVASACVLLRRKYIPPLMDTYQDITITVNCPMKIMGKGRFTDEDLIMECRLVADSVTTLNEKSTVDEIAATPSRYVDMLQAKDLLSSIGEHASTRSSLCEMIEELKWAVVEGVGGLLGGGNNESEAVRNAWYSRAASYLAHCVNGGLLGSRLTLKTILSVFPEISSTLGKESIRSLLCFLLHVRHCDFDVSYQPDDIRLVAGKTNKFHDCTYNSEVMEALVETGMLTSLLKVEDGPPSEPGEAVKLIFANLLGHPSSSLTLKICVCEKIAAMKRTAEASAASSGSTTPSSACRQDATVTEPSEILAGALLRALRKEKALVLRTEITKATTSMVLSCTGVKESLEGSGLLETTTINLSIKDDLLILASLKMLCCLNADTGPMKAQHGAGMFTSAARAAAQIIKTNCDTKSKATVVAHACKFLGDICRDKEARKHCLTEFPTTVDCILRAFGSAPARSGNQALCLCAIHSLCWELSEEETVAVRDAVTGVLVRDLGELFIRLIPSAEGSGLDAGLVEYIESALLVFDLLTRDGMQNNCLFLKEKGLPHVLSSMRSKLPKELPNLEMKASALEERIREGSCLGSGLSAEPMVVEGGTNQAAVRFSLAAMLGSAAQYASLLRATVSAVDGFNPNKQTVDGYLDDYCDEIKQAKSEIDKKFIRQCVYGCMRYKKFLKVFVTAFLEFRPAVTQRSDQTLYTILAYLIFLRLEELTVPELSRFMDGCSPPTMLALLEFAFDRSAIEAWVYTEWAKIYDDRFIEETILRPIEKLQHECDMLLNSVSRKATGNDAKVDETLPPIEPKMKYTVPSPFKLTEPKPRKLPEPQETTKPVTSKPVPKFLETNSLDKVKERDEARMLETKEKTLSKYNDDLVPTLSTANRAADIESLRKELNERQLSECTFHPSPAKPVPKTLPESEVKATAASLLREYSLLTRKQETEHDILKKYLTELRDGSEFHEWQNKMYAQDELDEKLRVERRKLEMHLAREQAAEASSDLHRKNNMLANIQKETVRVKLEEAEREIEEALEQKRDLVTIVQSEVMKVSGRYSESGEDEYEMERRKDMIMQIRALERVSVVKTSAYDPSEVPHHGLLEEMSLSELKERLKLAREADEAERVNRRAHNLEQKRIQQESLLAKAEQLSAVRQQARIEADERHRREAQAKADEAELEREIHEKAVLEVTEKIAEKKRQRLAEERRLQEELMEITRKRAALAESSKKIATMRQKELHKGRRREAYHRQKVLLDDKSRQLKVLSQEKAIREMNVAQAKSETEDMRTRYLWYDAAMAKAKVEDDYRRMVRRTAVNSAHTLQRAQEDLLSKRQAEALPYAAKINATSIKNARVHATDHSPE